MSAERSIPKRNESRSLGKGRSVPFETLSSDLFSSARFSDEWRMAETASRAPRDGKTKEGGRTRRLPRSGENESHREEPNEKKGP